MNVENFFFNVSISHCMATAVDAQAAGVSLESFQKIFDQSLATI